MIIKIQIGFIIKYTNGTFFRIFAAEAGIRACHSEWHILSAS